MTKDEIVIKISEEYGGVPRYFISRVIDTFLKYTKEAVVNGENVKITGFGTFKPKSRAPRMGRNPSAGEAVYIPARVVPSFEAGKAFKEQVNKSLHDTKKSCK